MSSITISADQLESCAARVSTLKTEMENTFNSTRSLIQGMNAYWQSPAASDAFAQFEQLSPIFPKYIELVSAYCSFLSDTAMSYLTEGKRIQRIQVAFKRFLFACNPML